MSILHLIPDTNLFIQCRPLEELDWSIWAEFDEIHIIVCRPVQREIDNQKKRGNDRVGKRARKTNALFRRSINSKNGYELIQEAKPQIKLLVDPTYQPTSVLRDQLDYSEIDDQIVGCAYTFKACNPESDVRLLTHDTGPMASAQMCSLPFAEIPDDWILPPESNDTEKENAKLREELERYKKTEPHFVISCLNHNGDDINSFEFEGVCYEPLTGTEVSELMNSLTRRFPLVTDFEGQEPKRGKPKNLPNHVLGKEVFTPASQQEISDYTEKDYPEWVEKCTHILEQLHLYLEKQCPPVFFSFTAVNTGTRPGKSALVTITAKGNFQIRPPQIKDTDDEESEQDDLKRKLGLPPPPRPPKGKWTTNDIFNLNNLYNQLQPSVIGRIRSPQDFELPDLTGRLHFQRDPNEFYYKPERATVPEASFSLECAQWRHGVDAEIFEGELVYPRDSQKVSGALECLIQAENLSAPIKKTVPVRGSIKFVNIREHAKNLVKNLIGNTSVTY